MSDLHRFVRRLAESVAARDPAGLRAPLALAEIAERIMPYRACRKALDLESVEEYELLLMRLAAEEARLAQVWPPDAAERCRVELSGPHPDLALIRQLPDVTLQLDLGALAGVAEDQPVSPPEPPPLAPHGPTSRRFPTLLLHAPVHAEPEAPDLIDHPGPDFDPTPDIPPIEHPAAPIAVPSAEAPMSADSPAAPVECPHCTAALPRDREVRFCPHCGGNVRTRRCAACRTELELAWRHCVMCGQAVGEASRLA